MDISKLIEKELNKRLGSIEKRLDRIETVLDIQNGDFQGNSILVDKQVLKAIDPINGRLCYVEAQLKSHNNLINKKKSAQIKTK